MLPTKGLLFDLDGVLLDTEPLHGKAWTETASSFGTTLNNNQLRLLQGRRRYDCAQQVKLWINKPIEISEILKVHQPISKKFLSQATAIPGAKELVTWCHENKFPIALVTSSGSSSLEAKAAPHPWIDFFSIRVQGDDPSLSCGKPSPEPYLLGAKKLGINPNECLALEDSLSGAKSAFDAGCKVWILKNESNRDLIKENYGDSVSNPVHIDNLNKVLKLIN